MKNAIFAQLHLQWGERYDPETGQVFLTTQGDPAAEKSGVRQTFEIPITPFQLKSSSEFSGNELKLAELSIESARQRRDERPVKGVAGAPLMCTWWSVGSPRPRARE